jgi:hypothetical protein
MAPKPGLSEGTSHAIAPCPDVTIDDTVGGLWRLRTLSYFNYLDYDEKQISFCIEN